MRIIFSVIVFFCLQEVLGQNSRPYEFGILPSYELNKTELEDGFIDLYTVFGTDTSASKKKPKFLIYVIFSENESLENLEDIDDNKLALLTQDLKCDILESELFTTVQARYHKSKASFRGKNAFGSLYITAVQSKLIRVLFMYPNEAYFDKYSMESEDLISSLKLNL